MGAASEVSRGVEVTSEMCGVLKSCAEAMLEKFIVAEVTQATCRSDVRVGSRSGLTAARIGSESWSWSQSPNIWARIGAESTHQTWSPHLNQGLTWSWLRVRFPQ